MIETDPDHHGDELELQQQPLRVLTDDAPARAPPHPASSPPLPRADELGCSCFCPRDQDSLTLVLLACCSAIEYTDYSILPGMTRAFQEDFNASLKDVGTLYLLQSLALAVSMPAWGYLGDRMSRKALLCGGCFAWGVLTLACALSTTATHFMAFRTCASVFMSLVPPTTQSMVADIVPSETRGSVFGKVAFVSSLGTLFGQFVSTAVAEEVFLGVRGWRLCLLFIAALSIGFPFVMRSSMREPRRQTKATVNGTSQESQQQTVDWASLKVPTFWLLVLQGIFGTVPWRAFGMFSVLWLELIGYSPLQVATIGGLGTIAGSIGHLISGHIGDYAHNMIPYRGRIFVAQCSVGGGMLLLLLLYRSIGRVGHVSVVPLALMTIAFRSVAGWAANGTNRPVIADIAPPWSRASMYSYFCAIESVPSSFAGYLVSYIAEHSYGFKGTTGSNPGVNGAEYQQQRQDDVDALTEALKIMSLVPWTTCFCIYGLIHFTYVRDVERTKLRMGKGAAGFEEMSVAPANKAA